MISYFSRTTGHVQWFLHSTGPCVSHGLSAGIWLVISNHVTSFTLLFTARWGEYYRAITDGEYWDLIKLSLSLETYLTKYQLVLASFDQILVFTLGSSLSLLALGIENWIWWLTSLLFLYHVYQYVAISRSIKAVNNFVHKYLIIINTRPGFLWK